MPVYFQDFVHLAEMVDHALPTADTVADGERDLANKVTATFAQVARLARGV